MPGQCWELFAEGVRKRDEERLEVDLPRCCLIEKNRCARGRGCSCEVQAQELQALPLGSLEGDLISAPAFLSLCCHVVSSATAENGPSEEEKGDQLFIG